MRVFPCYPKDFDSLFFSLHNEEMSMEWYSQLETETDAYKSMLHFKDSFSKTKSICKWHYKANKDELFKLFISRITLMSKESAD